MKRKTIKNKLDKAFSELIRLRGKCERCGKVGRVETSHHFSRRNLRTRWLVANATALCHYCHRDWHSNPVRGAEWLKSHIGEEAYLELRGLSDETWKPTDKELLDLLEELRSKIPR